MIHASLTQLTPVLAQVAPLSAPPPEVFLGTLKSVVLIATGLGVLAGLAVGIRALWKRHEKASEEATRSTSRRSPEPRVARAFCDQAMGRMDERFEELEAEDARLAKELETLKTGIGAMELRLEKSDEERASRIHVRLDKMPGEIVAGMLNHFKLAEALKEKEKAGK